VHYCVCAFASRRLLAVAGHFQRELWSPRLGSVIDSSSPPLAVVECALSSGVCLTGATSRMMNEVVRGRYRLRHNLKRRTASLPR
jgi:hypothetical protein